jgi:hypothetical protein
MADIKILNVVDAESGLTTSRWDGPKVTYALSAPANQDWQNEFKLLLPKSEPIKNSYRAVNFSGAKMIVECEPGIDPDALNEAIEAVVNQTNKNIDDFHKGLDKEKFPS